MALIRSHCEGDVWKPRRPWRDDDVLQWSTEADFRAFYSGPHFFEVFPREGSYIRGEGSDQDAAEDAAFAKAVNARTCREHHWRRKFQNGLGTCCRCGARQTAFAPIVETGDWKAPLAGHELDWAAAGNFEPVDHPELATDHRSRHSRRILLRCRMFGIGIPDPPDKPKDILDTTPYEMECRSIVLNFIKDHGGDEVFASGEIRVDGRIVALPRTAMSSTHWAWKEWRDSGFPDLKQEIPHSILP